MDTLTNCQVDDDFNWFLSHTEISLVVVGEEYSRRRCVFLILSAFGCNSIASIETQPGLIDGRVIPEWWCHSSALEFSSWIPPSLVLINLFSLVGAWESFKSIFLQPKSMGLVCEIFMSLNVRPYPGGSIFVIPVTISHTAVSLLWLTRQGVKNTNPIPSSLSCQSKRPRRCLVMDCVNKSVGKKRTLC